MPYKPNKRVIKRKKDKGIPLTEEQLQHLIHGWIWLEGWGCFPFENEEHRRQCWQRHKKEIMNMMTDKKPSSGFTAHLLVGQRPQAWFDYEKVPSRKRVEVDGLERLQPTPDYLDQHQLWLTDEKRRHERMRAEERRLYEGLAKISDLDDFRDNKEVFTY